MGGSGGGKSALLLLLSLFSGFSYAGATTGVTVIQAQPANSAVIVRAGNCPNCRVRYSDNRAHKLLLSMLYLFQVFVIHSAVSRHQSLSCNYKNIHFPNYGFH